jgi:fructose-bisphosphate aldolase, class I
MNHRPNLDDLDLSLGKRTRLHRLLYEHGPGNGTLLLLPIDQGLEHGPVDFFANPAARDPDYQLRLALEGGYSGIAFHIGLAEKYMKRYAGKVPLVLKISGKTSIPSDDEAFSPQTGTVEDAVRLGADAVGYTLYVGSPAQSEDIVQLMQIREDCDYYGMPLMIWAYPRGYAVEDKGGRDSLWAVDYAARVALELGADIVKLNVPEYDAEKVKMAPKPYNAMPFTFEEGVARVVASAGKAFVLFSGGSKMGDADLIEKVRVVMKAGGSGVIFGRNMWQRPFDEGIQLTQTIREILLAS